MASRCSPHPRYRLYTGLVSYLPRFDQAAAVERFEAEICRRFGVSAAVCVPMARTGLYLTLLETIKPGQKVIMSPLTIVDVVNVVLLAGGVPVFADICRRSCSIDPEAAESLIDARTGAVLITHLHGQTAGARQFREICQRRGVRLIEDAAQAFGAVEVDKHLGTIGDAGIYSFGFFKNLSTWRGGMVVSQDRALIERIRDRARHLALVTRRHLMLRAATGLIVDIGTWPQLFARLTFPIVRRRIRWIERRLDPEAGRTRLSAMPQEFLGRMRPWQAAMGLQQLNRVNDDNRARIGHAARYHDGFDGVPWITSPQRTNDRSNIYTYFPIQMADRERVLEAARKSGRDVAAQHLRNCADLPMFCDLYRDCPNARAAAAELILLPTYPRYPEREIALNIDAIIEAMRKEISIEAS